MVQLSILIAAVLMQGYTYTYDRATHKHTRVQAELVKSESTTDCAVVNFLTLILAPRTMQVDKC